MPGNEYARTDTIDNVFVVGVEFEDDLECYWAGVAAVQQSVDQLKRAINAITKEE